MKSLTFFLLAVSLALPAVACGKSKCEKAFSKEIDCEEDPEEKKEMKQAKDIVVALCEADKSEEGKARVKCYTDNDSCDAIKQCEAGLRAADDAKRIAEQVSTGDYDGAISSCGWDTENYQNVPELKEICDKAITEGFAKLDSPGWKCQADNELFKVSDALKTQCKNLAGELKKKLEASRDAGADDDYSTCSTYKDVIAATDAENTKAAEMLCKEVSIANYAKKAVDESKANVEKKEADIPYECSSFLDNAKDMGESGWFKTKSAEVAKACYGDLGKIVLAEVDSYCTYSGKQVYTAAMTFKLGESDSELAALLDKTSKLCTE